MSEPSFLDSLQFEDAEPLIPDVVIAQMLEQPMGIAEVADDVTGSLTTYTSEATIEPGDEKNWTPDDTAIAVARKDSEIAPLPFRDPVDEQIISGGGA